MLIVFLIVSEERGTVERRPHGTLVFNFDADSFDRSSAVDHSSLRMLLPPVRDELITRIQIHQVIEDGRGRKNRYLIDSKNVYLSDRDAKWCEFEVTSAVKRWMALGRENSLKLELHCPKCNQRRYDLRPVEPAVINVLLVSGDSARERRSVSPEFQYRKDRRTDCKMGGKKCCRQEMNFDLEKLGFSFIIQPKRYDAGICKGRCPPNYNAAHNHAVLQGIMWKKNKTATPRVCCAPSKLTHLEVLTVDEEDPTKLAVRDLPNMIVLECACS